MLSERERYIARVIHSDAPRNQSVDDWLDEVCDLDTGMTVGEVLDLEADEMTNEFTGTVTREPVK